MLVFCFVYMEGRAKKGIIRNILKHSPGFMLIRFYLTKRRWHKSLLSIQQTGMYYLVCALYCIYVCVGPINHMRSGVKILHVVYTMFRIHYIANKQIFIRWISVCGSLFLNLLWIGQNKNKTVRVIFATGFSQLIYI